MKLSPPPVLTRGHSSVQLQVSGLTIRFLLRLRTLAGEAWRRQASCKRVPTACASKYRPQAGGFTSIWNWISRIAQSRGLISILLMPLHEAVPQEHHAEFFEVHQTGAVSVKVLEEFPQLGLQVRPLHISSHLPLRRASAFHAARMLLLKTTHDVPL